MRVFTDINKRGLKTASKYCHAEAGRDCSGALLRSSHRTRARIPIADISQIDVRDAAMTIDQVAPVELPDFDAKPLMNDHFRKWVEQRRAELEREHSISELAPRVARMLASGTVLCLPPHERLRRRRQQCG
jgi:hypothetical protein